MVVRSRPRTRLVGAGNKDHNEKQRNTKRNVLTGPLDLHQSCPRSICGRPTDVQMRNRADMVHPPCCPKLLPGSQMLQTLEMRMQLLAWWNGGCVRSKMFTRTLLSDILRFATRPPPSCRSNWTLTPWSALHRSQRPISSLTTCGRTSLSCLRLTDSLAGNIDGRAVGLQNHLDPFFL
jgi:hypothetical protein